MSHAADQLIAAWLTDDLDAEGVRALEDLLRSDVTARARFARFCQSEVVLPQALAQSRPRPATTGIRRAVRSGSKRMRLRRPDGRLNWLLPAAAAALVAVIVLVTVIARPSTPTTAAPLIAQPGPLDLLRADGEVRCAGQALRPGMAAPRGAQVEIISGTAELQWHADGSTLIASPGTMLRVDDGVTCVHLLRGRLDVQVTHRATTPFAISGPHASATVMGTRFTLQVGATTTDLAVSEGRVRFIATGDATLREVIAGESATADASGLRLDGQHRVRGFVPTTRDITQVLGPRLSGRGTLRLADLKADGINLRIECTPEVRAVRTGMRGVDSRLEQVPAFHVFGDVRNRASTAWNPRVGTFQIDAQPFADAAGKEPLGPAVVFELTIVP